MKSRGFLTPTVCVPWLIGVMRNAKWFIYANKERKGGKGKGKLERRGEARRQTEKETGLVQACSLADKDVCYCLEFIVLGRGTGRGQILLCKLVESLGRGWCSGFKLHNLVVLGRRRGIGQILLWKIVESWGVRAVLWFWKLYGFWWFTI